MLSRLENDILGTAPGQKALDAMIIRSALLKWKNKRRLILDVDSTEDPAHGNQENAAFASPEIYEYCEFNRITYFIRIRANSILNNLIRPPRSGIQVKYVELDYQARSWNKARRVVAKIEWHFGELFPRYNFVVTNSRLPAAKVVKVYEWSRHHREPHQGRQEYLTMG
jgi:hypothetical protein